jgi:hypothetical protein
MLPGCSSQCKQCQQTPLLSLLHYYLQVPLAASHTAGGVHTQAPSLLLHVASKGQMHTPFVESHGKLLGQTHFFVVVSLQQQHHDRQTQQQQQQTGRWQLSAGLLRNWH